MTSISADLLSQSVHFFAAIASILIASVIINACLSTPMGDLTNSKPSAMLNFDNKKNFELGIAGSLTLIRDLFWVGYGRNLQAQADYFFVGVNPIALGSLYKQKTQ